MVSNTNSTAARNYVAGVVALAILALGLSEWSLPDASRTVTEASDALGLLAFLLVGVGLERAQHKLALGSASGSIAFIAYLGAVVAFGPTWSAVIAGTSFAIAELLIGKPLIKLIFNVAQHVVALILAGAVYVVLGGETAPVALEGAVLPYLGAVLAYFIANSGMVSGVIAISERRRFSEVWVGNTWGLAFYDFIASAFGLGMAWLYLRFGVLGMAAVVVPILFLRHTYLVNLQLQSTNRELLDLMVKAIEARDPYTSGHSQRVAELARALAREMGLHFREVDNIATAALLHDVGKIYEDFAPILRKEGKLTTDERLVMESHPSRSAELVATISTLRGSVERCVRHHHENFDGSGYPGRLVGDEIPLGARVVLVADTVDAMTTDRPYRKALPWDRVMEELERYSGSQFDPRVVEAFKRSITVRRLVESRQPLREPASAARGETSSQLVLR
jgi:putative nucleotidyltransferase with HDIG domain